MACLLVWVFGAAGQEFRYRDAKPWGQIGLLLRPDPARFYKKEKRFSGSVFDPQAEAVLRAAEAVTKKLFNFQSLQLQRAVAYRDTRGDIVLAEWHVSEPFASGTVLVEDTPFVSEYLLRLTNCNIATRDDLTAFLSRLLVWGQPPAKLRFLQVNLPPGAARVEAFGGVQLGACSPLLYFCSYQLTGEAAGGEWLLRLQVGKDTLSSEYPVSPRIPERFPPLAELVKGWDGARIRSELGKPFTHAPYGDVSGNRNRFLVAELARRGLSVRDIVELLESASPSVLAARAHFVVAGLKDAGDPVPLSGYIEPAMKLYRRLGPRAGVAVRTLFANASKACAPVFEEQALDLLKEGILVEGPLGYLRMCASSQESLVAVDSAVVPQQHHFLKEDVSRAIRGRLMNPRP